MYVDLDENEMKIYDNHYFRINKKLQIYCGLWPYETGAFKFFKSFLLYGVLFLAMIPLCNGFRTWCGVDLDVCGENAVGIVYLMTIFTKYFATSLSERKLRHVYQRVARNWLSITDPTEHAILTNYASQGKFKSVGYVVYMVLAALGFCQIPMVPIVLDFILPKNESRQRILFVKGEFIIDPYEHFYKLYLFYTCVSIMSIIAITSIDTTYTAIVHQILGIFSIIKYRLHLATISFDPMKDVSYEIIVKSIQLHIEALQFIDLIESSYSLNFLLLIAYTILSISVGAVVIMVHVGAMVDAFRLMLVVIGFILHILYVSWPGQLVIDHSCDLFLSTYTTEWYNISEKSKRLLKLIMLRCIKPCVFTAGGLYVMNLENFGAIMKSAVSYIAVVGSFR